VKYCVGILSDRNGPVQASELDSCRVSGVTPCFITGHFAGT